VPPSIDGALLKLRRGKEHADALKGAIESSQDSIRAGVQFDADRGRCIAWIERAPTMPAEWSLLVGDCIANLRAALDYLAYELVALDNGGVYDERTQFPIADAPERLSSRDQRTLKLLTPGHRATIESHQPYAGTNPPWVLDDLALKHPLAVLREMSNQDKHRLLVGTYIGVTIDRLEIGGPDLRIGNHRDIRGTYRMRLEPGAELFSVPVEIVGPKPQVQMNVDFTPFVSFAQERDVIKVLELLGAKVAEIVREFEPAF
jgi:hypothetical protein